MHFTFVTGRSFALNLERAYLFCQSGQLSDFGVVERVVDRSGRIRLSNAVINCPLDRLGLFKVVNGKCRVRHLEQFNV